MLPYRAFSRDQRVSYTATVENKRFCHALKIVRSQQQIKRTPKITPNIVKSGDQKRPRQLHGPDYKEALAAPKAGEMTNWWKGEENMKPGPSLHTVLEITKTLISYIPTSQRLQVI